MCAAAQLDKHGSVNTLEAAETYTHTHTHTHTQVSPAEPKTNRSDLFQFQIFNDAPLSTVQKFPAWGGGDHVVAKSRRSLWRSGNWERIKFSPDGGVRQRREGGSGTNNARMFSTPSVVLFQPFEKRRHGRGITPPLRLGEPTNSVVGMMT